MSLILLVEGPNDVHVTQHILLANDVTLQLGSGDKVLGCGGISKLLDEILPATLKGSSYGAIGVIVDANGDVEARWQAVRHRLSEAGFDVPTSPDPGGTILTSPRVAGVWIMPDNRLAGSVETFVERLIPQGDALWPMARESVAVIPTALRRFSASAALKAELHTYLAWQEEPGTPLGAAIAKRYFESGGPTAEAFVAWVKRLLEMSTK